MAKSQENTELEQDPEDLSELDEIAEDDYIFIVKADGTMKSVIFPPEEEFEYSKKLLKVFKALGITDPDSLLESRTLH